MRVLCGHLPSARRTGPSAPAVGSCFDLRRRRAKRGGEDRRVELQVIRDWVLRFNAHGPDGFVDPQGARANSKAQ